MKNTVQTFLDKNPNALDHLSELAKQRCQLLQEACTYCKKLSGNDRKKADKKLAVEDRAVLHQIEQELAHLIPGNINKASPESNKADKAINKDEAMLKKLLDGGVKTITKSELEGLGFKTEINAPLITVGEYALRQALFSLSFTIILSKQSLLTT